ncbi:MAG: hypothetical protein KF753_23140 [Caldilineaceae bacterium]|nr:hypothetical protein [Caldilineaceae bacterium]
MINFPRSTFTWKSHPQQPDPHYKYAGGYVSRPGQIRHVRFNLEAKCEIQDDTTRQITEMFVGAPCRTEYTIADRNLFMVPSSEFRMAFSRARRLAIAKRPSDEIEPVSVAALNDDFQGHTIDIRELPGATRLTDGAQIVEATLANHLLGARSTYRDAKRGLHVTVEYPVNLINVVESDNEFQICTGPVILPDLNTWDGQEVSRVFLAHVSITSFDYVEFILQREVAAAASEREWLDQPRGRDRFELIDPENPPPNYPPPRPRPTVYNEVWGFPSTNVVLMVENN